MAESVVNLAFNATELLAKYDCSGKLRLYFDVLRTENRKVNLVSRETINGGLETLAAESLLPFEKIEPTAFDSYLDIGSGGGFPSVPVILALDIAKATLFERASKKSLALERIIKGLALDRGRFRVEPGDFEQVSFDNSVDLITMRLVKLTPKLLRKVSEALHPGGHFVYYSSLPENISVSDFSCLSYCYRVSKDAPEKSFTIFQKN